MTIKFLTLILSFACSVGGFAPSFSRVTGESSSKLCEKKEATFGMGCFWKPAEELLKTEGVIDTVAGYTGKAGAVDAPSYDNVCFGREWVEGVRVYYDDDKVTYEQLLEAFFEAQEPKMNSRQYASIIFPHDDKQQKVASEWLTREKERTRSDGVPVGFTEMEPLTKFYQAEGYHQRYWAKQRPRFAGIVGLIAISSGIVDSYVPADLLSSLHTGAEVVTLAVCAYVTLERVIDAKVVEI
mmetsp:Transcript_19508/g.32377  ORF Transcript_19508/g.32377 Transcript_19508/m.32377 type:complete len:240 (-) Transcript_19508:1166-1885(-)